MITQRDIYSVNLNPVKGHEQAGIRPVVILQNNLFNKHLSTVVIIPLTTNMEAKGKTSTSYIEKEKSGLKEDSIALLFQIKTIDKKRHIKKLGKIDRDGIQKMKQQFQYLI